MKEPLPFFDICIVCAMHEEAEAIIDEFSKRCHTSFMKAHYGLDHYEYQYTTIQNKNKEPLTVLVTWLPEMGPTAMAQEVKSLVQQFHPRFMAMTGICAGDRRKVRLGDLIVASAAYHYEEGKMTGDPQEHQPATRTFSPSDQILQYARGFTDWEKLITQMKAQFLKQDESAIELPKRFVAVMASGMAVRADNPFPWLQQQYHRQTLALDMEAASFYAALRSFTNALVVKGVCDYADITKNDTYHHYAARASAVYLLHFIQEYVTQQTMPRRNDSDRALLPEVADVPLSAWQESNNGMLSNNKIKEFDVFLCHNSLDKEEVREIGRQLQKEQIRPWLDEWELLPGYPWQRALEKQIAHIKSAAVFFGAHGIRNWQWLEAEAFLREFVRRGCPVIPVIMSSAPSEPEIPLFLQGMMWVDFRQERPDPLHQLIRGIRGAQEPDLGVVLPPPRPTKIRVTYQPSREGNKGMILFLLNGTEHTLEYMRRDNLSHQIFFLKRKEQELVRLVMPFATLKSLEKCAEFQIDGVDCRFTIKMSAVTSIMSVKLEIGEVEVFRT